MTPPPAPDSQPPAALASQLTGGNAVVLQAGGDELFPAMCAAIAAARHQVWVATYIFHDDPAAHRVALALADAARRGVWVGVVVDGFGSKATLPRLRSSMMLMPPTKPSSPSTTQSLWCRRRN